MRAAALATVAMAILATAGRAHAVTQDRFTFNGKQVATFTFASTSVDCGDAGMQDASVGAFISGGEQVTHAPPGPPTVSNGVLISIFSFFDPCTGRSFAADGQIVNGLSGPNPNLKSARMTGATTVQDFNDPNNPIPVALNLTVTGSGPISSSGGTTQTRTFDGPGGPFTITISRGAFSNRPGTVSGTLTVAGIVFDLTGSSADLISNSSSQITISKP